ncbi:hypothetical protein [Chryseobacterium arthrosphaerae]|uniref:hypothetical protein n=1 Tax=Chryseobacterium arthrosphaerae TaxID=651561 RepID=UPI0031DD5CD1
MKKFLKKYTSFFASLITAMIVFACQKQSLDEKVLEFEDFNFSVPISSLLPERMKSKDMDGFYEVKSSTIRKDTVYDNEFSAERKPKWIEYHQMSHSTDTHLANFGDFDFNTVNFVTALDGKIMLLNAVDTEITPSESGKFIAAIDKKYGKAVKTTGDFFGSFDIYTWNLKDRVIKYSVAHDDEKGTLKIEVNAEQGKIKAGEKKPHSKAYLYIAPNDYAGKIFEDMTTGDLLYCK